MKNFEYIQGQVGPLLRIANASFTRPADVIAYAPYDLIRPSTAYTGSVLHLTDTLSTEWTRGAITSVRLMTTNPDITNVSFRVLFFNAAKGVVADNVEFTTGNWLDYYYNFMGYADVALTQTDGTRTWGMATDKRIPFEVVEDLHAFILPLKSPTYTPVSGQNFFLEIAAECDR